MRKILCVPDLHAPFSDADAVSFVYAAIAKEKPDVVIQLGDAWDCFSFSKFPGTRSLMTPREEIKEARQFCEAFWRNVENGAPKAKRIQMIGNHEARIPKRLLEQIPALEDFLSFNDCFKYRGVDTFFDPREEVVIDDILFTHGHFTQPGRHVSYYLRNVVHGHTHRGGVTYLRTHDKVLYELDCGHLADEKATPLQYTATKQTKWTLGFGLIDEYGPRFVSLA